MLLAKAVAPDARHRWRWAALAVLLVAEAMNLLDTTVVYVAAPAIHAGLGGPAAIVQWCSAAYTLAFAALLVTGGRLGDRYGRRRTFRVGVAGFVLASAACALAPGPWSLVAFRAVQGAAAALVVPQTIGLIKVTFRGPELPRALGTIGPVMGLAAICGPVLGGVLTHADLFGGSWRAVFLVNVPLGLAVLLAAPLLTEDRAEQRPGLDPVGTLLVVAGTVLVVAPLVRGGAAHRGAWTWPVLGAGVLVLAGFALHARAVARRGGRPLVEPGLFRDRGFPAALAGSTLFFATTSGLTLAVPLHLQLGLHLDARTAGFSVLPWSAAMAVASVLAGRHLAGRYGWRLMPVGLVLLLAGVLGAVAAYATAPTTAQAGAYPWRLLPALALCGLGVGTFSVAFFTVALHRVRPQETGSAAGLLNAVQQLGGTLGVAVLGSTFLAAQPAGADPAAVRTWLVAAALVAATAVPTALMRRPSGS